MVIIKSKQHLKRIERQKERTRKFKFMGEDYRDTDTEEIEKEREKIQSKNKKLTDFEK